MQAPKGRAVRGSGGILPQKSLKSWSFKMPFLVFWEQNFCLKSSLNQLWFLCKIFLCGASCMSIRFYLFLCVSKVFWCIRFCYVYPDTGMCSCIVSYEFISKSWFSLSQLHNMVRIQDIQAKLGWLHSLWFNLILSKERKKTVYTLKAFSRILQFSCMLPMFLVESIPKQKLLKGLHATTETMQLSETSVVCRPHALIVLVIHLSHH